MPIIPVLQPEGDYSPPRMATPPLESLQGSYNARNAAGVAQAATDVATGLAAHQRVQAQFDADDAYVSYMTDVEKLKNDVKAAPPRMRPSSGTSVEDPDSGEGGWQYQSLGVQPKSETMVDDFQQGIERLNKQYASRLTPQAQKYFVARQSRIQAIATRQMMDAQAVTFDNEQLASLQKSVTNLQLKTRTYSPQQPDIDQGGLPTYDPEKNGIYTAQRDAITKLYDDAGARSKNPQVFEKQKEAALAKLGNDTATRTMGANPGAWLASVTSGKNGYESLLTPERFDTLSREAATRVNHLETEANKQREELQRQTMMAAFPAARSGQLAQGDIDQMVREGKLDFEHAKTLMEWNEKRGMEVDTPQAFNYWATQVVKPTISYADVDRMMRDPGLSQGTRLKLAEAAQKIIQHRTDRGDQVRYQNFQVAHSVGADALHLQVGLLDKIGPAEQQAKANEAAYHQALAQDYFNGGDPAEFQRKNLGSYISTQQGLIQPRIANLNKTLPAGGQVQQEQGKPISEENLNAAWQRALERYGKTPEDLDKGNLPDGLVRELRILRDIRVLNDGWVELENKRPRQ